MMENQSGGTPTVDDLAGWAANFGSDHPVVAGPANQGAFLVGYPTNPIIGKDMTVVNQDNFPFTQANLESHL